MRSASRRVRLNVGVLSRAQGNLVSVSRPRCLSKRARRVRRSREETASRSTRHSRSCVNCASKARRFLKQHKECFENTRSPEAAKTLLRGTEVASLRHPNRCYFCRRTLFCLSASARALAGLFAARVCTPQTVACVWCACVLVGPFPSFAIRTWRRQRQRLHSCDCCCV